MAELSIYSSIGIRSAGEMLIPAQGAHRNEMMSPAVTE